MTGGNGFSGGSGFQGGNRFPSGNNFQGNNGFQGGNGFQDGNGFQGREVRNDGNDNGDVRRSLSDIFRMFNLQRFRGRFF